MQAGTNWKYKNSTRVKICGKRGSSMSFPMKRHVRKVKRWERRRRGEGTSRFAGNDVGEGERGRSMSFHQKRRIREVGEAKKPVISVGNNIGEGERARIDAEWVGKVKKHAVSLEMMHRRSGEVGEAKEMWDSSFRWKRRRRGGRGEGAHRFIGNDDAEREGEETRCFVVNGIGELEMQGMSTSAISRRAVSRAATPDNRRPQVSMMTDIGIVNPVVHRSQNAFMCSGMTKKNQWSTLTGGALNTLSRSTRCYGDGFMTGSIVATCTCALCNLSIDKEEKKTEKEKIPIRWECSVVVVGHVPLLLLDMFCQSKSKKKGSALTLS
jgi:hypothetical protein